jgi:hypothetical protein
VPEPTLNLAYSEYTAEIGMYAGWGRDPAKWDARKAEEIRRVLETAQRQFYFAASPAPGKDAHAWSFLRPVADLQLTAGVATAALPADFGGFEGIGTLALPDGTAGGYWPVAPRHEEQLRALYAGSPTISGRTLYFAERQVKGVTGQGSERPELYVYPLPDAGYVLSVAYRVLPNAVTAQRPFPYGGAAHAETMKAAARAAAERLLDNRVNGPEEAAYRMLLASSISQDRHHQPKALGRNYDPSDARNFRRGRGWPEGLWHPLGVGYLGTADYGV